MDISLLSGVLTTNTTGDWIPLSQHQNGIDYMPNVVNIAVGYQAASGGTNGTIDIEVSMDKVFINTIGTVTIGGTNNLTAFHDILSFTAPWRYVRAVYTKNSVTTINVSVEGAAVSLI